MKEHLALVGLSKRFGTDGAAVREVGLSVPRGAFVTLLGPSGCGKTTTLRMIAGLTGPSGGRILVDGADITDLPAHRRNMGLVFQSYALFPHMDVARNVAFGLRMRGVGGTEAADRVRDALAMVRLDHLADRRPRELSGGQQQRVALARALVIRPSLLLLDEPLSNLDAKLREELRDEIRAIQTRLGITTVFVTHDQAEALTMSDQVVVMREGGVEQSGTPDEIYERPATPFVATFIGRMNQVAGIVGPDGALEAAGLRVRGTPALPPGTPAIAMVRPHRIHLGPGGDNEAAAVLRRSVFAGDTVEYHLDAAGTALVVEQPTRGPGASRPQPGDAVTVAWDASDTLLFPA